MVVGCKAAPGAGFQADMALVLDCRAAFAANLRAQPVVIVQPPLTAYQATNRPARMTRGSLGGRRVDGLSCTRYL